MKNLKIFQLFIIGNLAITPEEIDDEYIVVLNKGHSLDDHLDAMHKSLRAHGMGNMFELGHQYDSGIINGYSLKTDKDSIEHIRAFNGVSHVEKETLRSIHAVQENAPWGLARLSSNKAINGLYGNYFFDEDGGKGVNAYVIDTGINTKHLDFGGRARWGFTANSTWQSVDDVGHGTHVSGTIGGMLFGVAKKVRLTRM